MLSSMNSLDQQFKQQMNNHQTIILYTNRDTLYMNPTFLPCPTWGLSQWNVLYAWSYLFLLLAQLTLESYVINVIVETT